MLRSADPSSRFMAYLAQMGAGTTPGYDVGTGFTPGFEGLGPLNMLLSPIMSSLAAQNGMFLGQFNPTVNVADMMRADAERRQLMDLVTANAKNIDANSWLDTTGGMMRMAGAAWGLDQQGAFRQAYQQAAPVLSMLASFNPELVDQLHGSRGSAALMAQGLFRGAQYRAGAVSGMPGMSGEDVKTLSKIIEERLYGTPEDVAEMRGVGMGELGRIFDEAQRRGYMPGSVSLRSRQGQLDALSQASGDTVEELAQLDDAEFGRRLRDFDATRVSGRLKELAGAVSAVRELFGSMGESNAPMTQLLGALEALTQNRLASMPASEVEMTVRRTKALLETTGMSLDGLLSLTSLSAQYGDQMGLDRAFAVTAGQHAAGFAAAYKQAFGSDFRAFGALSPDALAQREALLTQRAAGSEQAQLAGAVVRTVEGLKVGTDTRAGRLAEALRQGETMFEGRSMYQVLRADNLQGILRESGVDEAGIAAFGTAARDKFGNQEYIHRYGMDAMVRRLQPQEVIERMGRGAGENAVMRAMVASGTGQEAARQVARQVGPSLLAALLNAEDPAQLSTQAGRQEIIRKTLAAQIGDAAANNLAPAITLSFESQMNRQAQQYGFGDMTKLLQSQNTTVLRQEAQIQRVATAEAEIAKTLSPLGKAGPLARMVDMIQAGDANADIAKALGKAIGGIEIDTIRDLLDTTKTVRTLSGKLNPTAADLEALAAARTKMQETVQGVVSQAKTEGVDVGRMVGDDEVDLLQRSATDVAKQINAATADPTDKQSVSTLAKSLRTQLARTGNMAQALYADDESLRKIGKGGAKLIMQMEGSFTELMRLTQGDTDLLARALAGDESVDKALRDKIQAAHGNMLTFQRAITDSLSTADAPQRMTDEELAAEKKSFEEFRKTRTAADDDQVQAIIDQLGELGGFDTKNMSQEDVTALRRYMGRFGETRRKDVILALAARKRIETEAKDKGMSVDDFISAGLASEADIAVAGGLANFGRRGKEDVNSLREAFESFGPADEGAVPGRQEVSIKGTLNISQDGDTGELNGVGFGGMGGFV